MQESKTIEQRLYNRDRFLRACRCQPVDYPPIWMMRQAGRALPEYRELKKKYSFVEIVRNPELAAEVTLQPIRRFDFDAAIIFSDILVVPEALGQAYRFSDGEGVIMDFRIETEEDFKKLSISNSSERLEYVYDAIKLVKSELKNKTALIGFSGSPWTLACFMCEGGSSRNFENAIRFSSERPELIEKLLSILTDAVIEYLLRQIDAGVDAIQIFDTLGGLLPPERFYELSGKWMKKIVRRLNGIVPVIVFSKGVHQNWDTLIDLGANVIGIDHYFDISKARELIPQHIGIQGNLNPDLLRNNSSDVVVSETRSILNKMKGKNGFIFNLGHGLPPDSKIENIEAVIQTVRSL
jgi:uroporphyrinogen decarboxylase